MAEELKIIQKLDEMMDYADAAIDQFPRTKKVSLGVKMQDQMDIMLTSCIRARKGYNTLAALKEFDVAIMVLQIYIRQAFRRGYLSPKKYEVWSSKVVEIGKMLGGWMKSVKPSRPGMGSRP